jgi:hypothetical protein
LVVDVVAPQESEPAFGRIEQSQPEALLVGVDPLIFNVRKAVIAFAARRRSSYVTKESLYRQPFEGPTWSDNSCRLLFGVFSGHRVRSASGKVWDKGLRTGRSNYCGANEIPCVFVIAFG